jgi:hypothetical protein
VSFNLQLLAYFPEPHHLKEFLKPLPLGLLNVLPVLLVPYLMLQLLHGYFLLMLVLVLSLMVLVLPLLHHHQEGLFRISMHTKTRS